jgi:hypothetical protein
MCPTLALFGSALPTPAQTSLLAQISIVQKVQEAQHILDLRRQLGSSMSSAGIATPLNGV